MSKIVVIAGPTASGKSELALKLALEKDGEIINADSIQIYSASRILSARPDACDEATVPHHLYGTLSPTERCSAPIWAELAAQKIAEVLGRGKLAIVVGGTGFYIKTLLTGISEIPDVSSETKAKSEQIISECGLDFLYAELAKIDPKSAAKIVPQDKQRIMRAWQVSVETSTPFSYFASLPKQKFFTGEVEKILVMPEREELYTRCNERFLKMIEMGALTEAKQIMDLKLDESLPFNKLLGYPELRAHLLGKISLEEAITLAQAATRHYAKRQQTWFKTQF